MAGSPVLLYGWNPELVDVRSAEPFADVVMGGVGDDKLCREVGSVCESLKMKIINIKLLTAGVTAAADVNMRYIGTTAKGSSELYNTFQAVLCTTQLHLGHVPGES